MRGAIVVGYSTNKIKLKSYHELKQHDHSDISTFCIGEAF